MRQSPQLRSLRRTSLLNSLAFKPQYKDFVCNHIAKTINKCLAHPVIDPNTGVALEYIQLIKHPDPAIRKLWGNYFCNELGRLTQGYKNGVQFTNCCEFISYRDIPTHKKPTYARTVAEV